MFDIHQIPTAAYCLEVVGDDFYFLDSNRACLELTGIADRFHPGLRPQDIFSPSVADMVTARYRACCGSGQAVCYVSRVAQKGERRWQTTLFPVNDERGRVARLVGICIPIEDDAADQVALECSQQALGTIDGGFWVYDVATETFEASRALTDLLAGPGHARLSLAEYVGHIHADDLQLTVVDSALDERTVEFRVVCHDGNMRWLQARRRRITAPDGTLVRLVGLVIDITEQKETISALRTEAATDPLTGLANRRAFDRAIQSRFADPSTASIGTGLVLIDLDGFKPVNDRLGHRAGDEILRQVARRLTRCARRNDLVARFGGDEFAVLTSDASPASLMKLVLRIQAALSKPFQVDDETVIVGAGCGTAIRTAGDVTSASMIERADRSLYAIKRGPRLLSA